MMNRSRGMSIIELMISLGVLLLVLGMATALFTRAYAHHTLTSENMSNEQEARLAMAKINSSLSQASVDTNPIDFAGTPSFPIMPTPFPSATSTPAIAFFRVATLDPAALGAVGAPNLTYKVHIISYNPATQIVSEYVTDWATYKVNGASPAPIVLARNVTDFGVTRSQNSTLEYQFQITINDIKNATTGIQAESPYSLIDNVHILQN